MILGFQRPMSRKGNRFDPQVGFSLLINTSHSLRQPFRFWVTLHQIRWLMTSLTALIIFSLGTHLLYNQLFHDFKNYEQAR